MNMHPDSLADSNDAPSRLDADPTWDVVIVYDDARAGRRAMITLDDVVHKLGGQRRLHPQLWRFDLLEDPDWCAAATAEAVQASLFIISASSKSDLPAAVRYWVRTCLSQNRGCAVAVVALLGPADDTDAPDSPRVQFLKSAAEAAGFGFFAPTPHAAQPPPASALSRVPARPVHQILLVEDDSAVRQVSAMVLVRAGYEVNAVEGCQAAWDTLQSRSYDLLITDNQMPGLTGLELVRKLRSAQSALPVILASGGIGERELTQNQWLQPAIALPKPFTTDQLLETVAEALHRDGRDLAHTEVSFSASGDPYRHGGLNE
jgi:CheY-like chemotaxis protein